MNKDTLDPQSTVDKKPTNINSLVDQNLDDWIKNTPLKEILDIVKKHDIPFSVHKSLMKKIETLKQSTSAAPSTSGAPSTPTRAKTTDDIGR